MLTYQWQRSSASGYQDIAGAIAKTYTLTGADVGSTVRVIVTATNVDGTQSAIPAASLVVGQPPANLTAPAAPSGTLMDTYALTADPGTWDSTLYTGSGPSTLSYGYQWLRCPASATVATGCATLGAGSSYRLAVADIGNRIAVKVTATTAGGSTVVVERADGCHQREATGQPDAADDFGHAPDSAGADGYARDMERRGQHACVRLVPLRPQRRRLRAGDDRTAVSVDAGRPWFHREGDGHREQSRELGQRLERAGDRGRPAAATVDDGSRRSSGFSCGSTGCT